METSRNSKAKKNILVSLACQFITLICGFLLPGALINAFGSEAYGASSSITQFLAYVALLEGGVGGVARAVLYKPLARKDEKTINEIMWEVRRFFRIIGWIYAGYVLILACSFKTISRVECMDRIATFWLVIAISISNFGQYFLGLSNVVLLQAAQRSYITNAVSIATTVLNTVAVLLLVRLDCSLIAVKLASSCIFLLRPVVLWRYVRKNYHLKKPEQRPVSTHLKDKWSGLGQHIAFFLHSNTDIAILTLFSNLQAVAVYSVYHMVTSQMQNIASSFVAGMEALFGDMLAKEERKQLQETFGVYETLISVFTVILFSAAAVLIAPFVGIYTAGVSDADYQAPLFSLLLILASVAYCLRMPYHAVVIAAGHFKQTNVAAYGEAVVNVTLSVLLVMRYGLVGVAAGTLAATCLRFAYYVYYLSKHILGRHPGLFVKRLAVNAAAFLANVLLGGVLVSRDVLSNYMLWACAGVAVTVCAAVVTLGVNLVFYRSDVYSIGKLFGKKGS